MENTARTNHEMNIYKHINQPYSPFIKPNYIYNHQKQIANKQSNQNSSTKSKDKYSLITTSFQSIKHSRFIIIISNLTKYNSNNEIYNKKVINNLIFEEQKQIVSRLRNILIWTQTSEFLKRFYTIDESKGRLPQISNYYETYTLLSPVYFGFNDSVLTIMIKYVKRKKKYLEIIEENENKLLSQNEDIKYNYKEQEVKYLIDPKEIEESASCKNSKTFIYDKITNSLYKDFSFFVNCSLTKNGILNDNKSFSSKVSFIEKTNRKNKRNYHIKNIQQVNNKHNIIKNNNALITKIKKLHLQKHCTNSKQNTTYYKNINNNNNNNHVNNISKYQLIPSSNTNTNAFQKQFIPPNKLLFQKIRKAFLSERFSVYNNLINKFDSLNTPTYNSPINKITTKKKRKHKPQVNLVIQPRNIIKAFTSFQETTISNSNKSSISKSKNYLKNNKRVKKQIHINTLTFIDQRHSSIENNVQKHKHKHVITSSPIKSSKINNYNQTSLFKHNIQPISQIIKNNNSCKKKQSRNKENSLNFIKKISRNTNYNNYTSIESCFNKSEFQRNKPNTFCIPHIKDKRIDDFTKKDLNGNIRQNKFNNKHKFSINKTTTHKLAFSQFQHIRHKPNPNILFVSQNKYIKHKKKSFTLNIFENQKNTKSQPKQYPLTCRNDKETLFSELINKLIVHKK